MRTYALTLSEQQRNRLIDVLEIEHDRLEVCLGRLAPDDEDDCAIIRDYITQTSNLVGQVAAAHQVSRRVAVSRSRQLQSYDGRSFYGKQPGENLVRGFLPVVRHGSTKGQAYSWIDFVGGEGIKWRVSPVRFRANGLPEEFGLFIRIKRADRFVFSGRRLPSAPGTLDGLYELVRYIRRYENNRG